MKYEEFLKTKIKKHESYGFDIEIEKLNKYLYPFQKFVVQTALQKGRYALFLECGLGKTICQLEWAHQINIKTNKPILILAPLAVSMQTKYEGEKFGINVNIAANQNEIINGINITNYEKLDKFNVSIFSGVILDESSILKSYMGKIKNELIKKFSETQYRLCCTATPSPNDHMEIGNHSEFIGIMRSPEMLMRWFINDTQNIGKYRVKNYARKNFWEWVASWSISMMKPSDIGFEDNRFNLPKLNLSENVVEVGHENKDGKLFIDVTINATSLHRELRRTAGKRAKFTVELIKKDTKNQWIIWVNTNYEADLLNRLIPEAIEIRGSDKLERKEKYLMGFAKNEFRILITKPKIAQFGLNYQSCNNMVFMGMSYSFESLYQSIRRCYRFKQKKTVNVYLVIAETEGNVLKTVLKKKKLHEEMQIQMVSAMNRINIQTKRNDKLIMKIEKKIKTGNEWEMQLGDSIELIKEVENDSIDFTIFSPPFANLYIYSDSVSDMGNCVNDNEFFEHFDFLINEMYRITRPGRLIAVHCKNLVNYKARDGKAGLRDFRGEIIKRFIDKNFTYHSEVCIWKCPVTEMTRTKAHGLLYKTIRRDASFSRQGLPDYLVIFRKWANENEEDLLKPVQSKNEGKNSKFDKYYGEDKPKTNPLKNETEQSDDHWHSIQVWQRYASPVWFDIKQTNVLNIRQAKDNQDEKHICPLQLDVINKAIHLWTIENDLVFSPFAGIGSEGYCAIKMNRQFLGFELKEEYFNHAVKNLKMAEKESSQIELFA